MGPLTYKIMKTENHENKKQLSSTRSSERIPLIEDSLKLFIFLFQYLPKHIYQYQNPRCAKGAEQNH